MDQKKTQARANHGQILQTEISNGWEHLSASGRVKLSTLRKFIILEEPLRHGPDQNAQCRCKNRELVYFTPRSFEEPNLDNLEVHEWSYGFHEELYRLMQFLQVMGLNKLFIIHQTLDDSIRERVKAAPETAAPWTIESDLVRAYSKLAAYLGFSSNEAAEFAVAMIWSAESHITVQSNALKPPATPHGTRLVDSKETGGKENTDDVIVSSSNVVQLLRECLRADGTVHRLDQDHGCTCLKLFTIDGDHRLTGPTEFLTRVCEPEAVIRASREALVPHLEEAFRLFPSKRLWHYAHSSIWAAIRDRILHTSSTDLEPRKLLLQSGDVRKVVIEYGSVHPFT